MNGSSQRGNGYAPGGTGGGPAAPPLSRRGFLRGLGGTAVVASGVVGWSLTGVAPATAGNRVGGRADRYGPEFITDWYRTLYSGLMDEGTTPPPAARLYAAAGVAAHEAVVGGAPHLRSLAGQLNGLTPVRRTTTNALDWSLVVSAAIGSALAALLRTGSPGIRSAIDEQLAAHVDQQRGAGIPAAVVARSLTEGRHIGEHVAAWALQDGADLTVGRSYTPPVGPDLWRSTPPNFGTAIDPHWGRTVRPFVLPAADACSPPPPPATFSTAEGSAFWLQAQTVLDTYDALTDAQRDIAMFWRDNPLVSGLPAGHWMLLVGQVCQERGASLERAAEVHALAGITLADAFTACWYEKYETNLLRPVTYIRDHVPGRETWSSFVNTPQFPEYTSGHSVASQAVASVLTATLGTFPFTDRTHADRNPQFGTRSFPSFQHAADEAAGSRLYGGIHYPMGIESGLAHGQRVADLILDRVSTRRTSRR